MLADLTGSVNKIKLNKKDAIFAIYEGVVNSIQSDSKNIVVEIKTEKNAQQKLKSVTTKEDEIIKEIIITDDGQGFTEENFNSFNKINSTHKLRIGGKGVGRLSWLKIFNEVTIESCYKNKDKYFFRTFKFDLINEVSGEKSNEVTNEEDKNVFTKIILKNLNPEYQKYIPKSAYELGEKILYHCLNYLIEGTFEITVKDKDSEYKCKEMYRKNLEKNTNIFNFTIENFPFELIYIPIEETQQQKHEIVFTADSREVKRKAMIGELLKLPFEMEGIKKNILVYVKSTYLNSNVTEDRTDFLFSKNEGNLFLNESDIIEHVSKKITEIFDKEIKKVLEKNEHKIQDFLYENPFYNSFYLNNKEILRDINLKTTNDEIEEKFEKIIKKERKEIKIEIKTLELNGEYEEKFNKIIKKVDRLNQLDLSKYVIHRKIILELFEKILQKKQNDSSYYYEKDLHNLIFPMREFGERVDYDNHNLWLIDDRLAYHKFLASDKPFNEFEKSENEDRMDIAIFDNPIAFSDKDVEDNHSNVIIIEFKRPGRENITSNDLDEQIYKYIEELQENKIHTLNGTRIEVSKNSIFNIYIICELSPKLIKTLNRSGFKKMIDEQGYYLYNENYNSFIQVLSLNKVLRDSKLRNKIFFKKLGIN